MKELLHVEDVAELLGESVATIQEKCARGILPNRRMPGMRRILIPRADFDAWQDGAELETISLARGGRVVRPVATKRAA